MVTGAESGKPQATRSSAMPLKNMHQLCFVAAVVCVAVLVYIASAVLGPSVHPDETDSLDHGGPPALQLSISGESLASQINELARLSESELPAVTRILFSKEDIQAREFIRRQMREAGMDVRDDEMGNIYGTWGGSEGGLPSVATGSHTDAIPLSGKFDGTLGVLGGIAAVAALRQAGFKPRRSIEVVMFTSEEPTRFGISCLGSRAMAGVLPEGHLTAVADSSNRSFVEAGREAGYRMAGPPRDMLDAVRARALNIGHFVELHIEQGPELEAEGVDVGIVTAIAAPATLRAAFRGDGGHAGSQLMPLRNDASLAAAELCIAIEKFVLRHGGADSVATCGAWRVEPSTVNSVPRVAELQVDLRDVVLARRDRLLALIQMHAQQVADRRKVRLELEVLNQDPPASCSPAVQLAAQRAVRSVPGLRSKHMVSHAYHDSLFVAQVAPTGMLFIPCHKGFSHRPDEYAAPAHMRAGVEVLALTLAQLSADGAPAEADTSDTGKEL